MIKKCPDCGSLVVEEVFDGEAYCKTCHLHCSVFDFEDASVFDKITESPEVLAPLLVSRDEFGFHSAITNKGVNKDLGAYDTEKEALAATLERLKEPASDGYTGSRVEV